MTDELNVVDDTQSEVVDPTVEEVSADDNGAEVAPAQQTHEENQAYAKMRRELEASQRSLAERESRIAEMEREQNYVSEILRKDFGYRGSLQEMADELMAMQTGQDVDEIRSSRIAAEQAEQERQSEIDRVAGIENELNHYKNIAVEKLKADILSDVKAVFPECDAKSVDEFGVEFATLVSNGVRPAVAYAALNDVSDATKKPVPPEIGTVNGSSAPERDYYTRDEVASMTKEEVHKNWDKIQRSRKKW